MTENKDARLLWIGFLKAFTRALVQINLYKPDSPQARQALDEGQALLAKITAGSPGGKFSLTLDNNKLIVNGSPLLTADKLPNSLKNLFSNFHIQTLSFLDEVSKDDLLALCQMQALEIDPVAYLKERGVKKISVSPAVYVQGDKAAAETAANPARSARGQAQFEPLGKMLAGQNLENSLATLAARAIPNAGERRVITELLVKKLKDEIETNVSKAVEGIRHEKKKIENDIARAETVISNIAEGVVVVDKDGKILMMNPQAETISGKTLSELSGKKIFDVTQLENLVLSLAKEIGSENNGDISKDLERKGKKELGETIKNATAIIQNEDGKIVGSVSVATDSAKLKQVEQMQRDFMANMTHELRSPLTSIHMALKLLAGESRLEDSTKTILNTAIRNSERLNSVITDILDFSKLQSGKLTFHPEDVPAGEIIKEAADAMKAWAVSKGVSLTAIPEPELGRVYADKRRTVQIMLNLISNSIKFTPAGGKIEISADSGKEALAGFIFFSVKDTGCGIKKEDQDKVFEKFVQVAAGGNVGGTGLGLAITKAMTVMQGGTITIESGSGRGATFRVGLPVYRSQPIHQITEPKKTKEGKALWRKVLGL
ncbi:MAG: ATP-binding protein [Elusimicrobia bacterium]|nr:ATP-binding protein [Elusimicrobiota bacterium]